MSSNQTAHDPGLYDLFVSYSTKDNLPPPGGKVGWVHAFIQRLRELAIPFTSENVTTTGDADAFPDWDTFYAPDEIQAGHVWETRLRTAVGHSRVLLACLSENYWNSRWCRIEWETYLENESARGLANQVGGITPIYFVTAPGLSAADILAQAPDWARDLLSVRQVRLLDFSEHGPELLVRLAALRGNADVEKRVSVIAARVAQQISHARRAERGQIGNIALGTDTFVGRQEELTRVENQLFGGGALGVITALRGIGGQGKTALALRYGQNLRARYSGGCWQIGAEKARELLPLLAKLREPLGLPASAEEDEAGTAGRVLGELHRRAHDSSFTREPGHPAAVLVLLDNVDHASLLAHAQRDALHRAMARQGCGSDHGWLHILATTRLEAHELAFLPREQIIPVDALPADKALELWQRIAGAMPPEELEAARQIIALVERHTLTVEIAARHIRRTLGETSVTYLARLRHALATGPTRLAHLLSGQQLGMQGLDLPAYAHPLAATLGFTFTHLAAEDPAAATVLHYAAHFPPEAVPLPWLRVLAGQHHPELSAESEVLGLPTAWDRAVLRLGESLRLLTPADTDMPEVVRLHRLAAVYLRATAENANADAQRVGEVEALIYQRCALAEQRHQAQFQPWERTVLLVDLPVRMERKDCSAEMARAGALLGQVITAYADLNTARRLTILAHAVFARLAASDPANAEWQRDLSVSLNKLGGLAVAQGDLAGALRYFTEDMAIAQRLAASDPANAAWQRDLSVSLERLGGLAVAQGDLAGALRYFTESKDIRERLAASDPANAEWQRDLAVSLNKLGDLAVAQGDLAGALRYFTDAKAIRERLAASDPANAEWQRDLSVSLNKLGGLAVAQGDLAGALRYLTEAKAIAQRLAASDPANAAWQMDLATSLNRLGDLAGRQGNSSEQLRCFDEALAVVRRLAVSDPANATWQTNYAGYLFNTALASHRAGQQDGVMERLNEAYRILRELESSGRLPPTGSGRQIFDHLKKMAGG